MINNWIAFYENEPDQAVVQLLQLFISCCGCLGTINSNMIHTIEYKYFLFMLILLFLYLEILLQNYQMNLMKILEIIHLFFWVPNGKNFALIFVILF